MYKTMHRFENNRIISDVVQTCIQTENITTRNIKFHILYDNSYRPKYKHSCWDQRLNRYGIPIFILFIESSDPWLKKKKKNGTALLDLIVNVIGYVKTYGNRVAAWYFGEPLTKKMVRDWRKQEEQPKTNRPNNQSVRRIVKWLQLE